MNDILALVSQVCETEEMKFSNGLITYIANQYFPGVLVPYPPEFTPTLTFDVCARIHDSYIDFNEKCPNAFEDLFDGYEKTLSNFYTLCEMLADTFLHIGYTHSDFILFCCEISEYAICMYKEGFQEAFHAAILSIFRVLWRIKIYWDNAAESPTCFNHWRYLDLFCSWTGDDDKENEPWCENN